MSSWTVVTNSARPFLRRRWPETVLALAIAGYVTLFAWKQYLKLYALHYPDFDLAIFYQGVWLLSRGETPFVTVRGLHLFADHATFVNLLLALPMRLVAHPLVLLWAKTAALGLAALPLYSIARRELESRRQALAVAACYLLHPAVHHLNLDSYHTSAFAVPLGLLVWLAAAGGRPRLLIASALALVLVKENMGLVLASLGLLMWVRGDRRGRWVAAGGIAATLLIVTVVIPAIAADHDYIYGGRMTTARAVLSGELGIAEFVGDHLVTPANLVFLRDLTVSLGFLPWASPVPLVLNPMLGLSLASDWPYAKEILYHYTSGLLPSLFLAFVFGWGRVRDWLRRRESGWRLAATCVAVLTMVAGLAYGHLARGPRIVRWDQALRPVPEIDPQVHIDLEQVRSRVGDDAVSASYDLLPFLAERKQLFMWPNPFEPRYFGPDGETRTTSRPEWLVFSARLHGDEMPAMAERAVAVGFEEWAVLPTIRLFRRQSREDA